MMQKESKPRRETRLRGQELTRAVSEQVVRGGDPEVLQTYLDHVRQRINEEETEPIDDDALTPMSGGCVVVPNLTKHTITLRTFVGAFCTADYWGGLMEADQYSIRDIVRRFTQGEHVQPFNPREAEEPEESLVELFKKVDQLADGSTHFVEQWERMATARSTLAEHVDLLIAEPIALLYADRQLFTAVTDYLDHYAALLREIQHHILLFKQRLPLVYRDILRGLLRLDVIFILASSEDERDAHERQWKALLTPLHPLHLWRYRTILERAGTQLSEQEQAQLTEALPNLPHLLHFVAGLGPDGNKITLPQAGSLETLPIYENRTNRYLGSDGVSFLSVMLKSWLAFAPYSEPQIRLALIDAPYLPDALREIWNFIRERRQTRVAVDVYRTRSQNLLEHLAEMDFEDHDSPVAEALLAGTLSLNLYNHTSLADVVAALEQRPVHITYSFDQSSYDLTKAARTEHHIVSPLVVTYKYGYDEGHKKGDISPSSDAHSGIFADYHHLVNQAIDLREDQSFQVQISRGRDVGTLNQLLTMQSTQWLAVADRTMLGYAPESAVPLVEQLHGRREVALWAHRSSRSVRQFIEMLRRNKLNLLPDEEHIAHLMQKYGHIAAGGLFSAARANHLSAKQGDLQRKGLLATIIAAHWYALRYPHALIASLDSGLARQWLALQTTSLQRADLVALREDEQGCLVLEPIEVKALEQAGSEIQVAIDPQTRERVVYGKAIEQLRATLTTLESIFAPNDDQAGLFVQARREALKYQLYRECFRELHSNNRQFYWYKLLNRAFGVAGEASKPRIVCQGLVIHVLFEEHGESEMLTARESDMTLVRLRDQAIQRLVVPPPPDGDPLPPSPPSPPAYVPAAASPSTPAAASPSTPAAALPPAPPAATFPTPPAATFPTPPAATFPTPLAPPAATPRASSPPAAIIAQARDLQHALRQRGINVHPIDPQQADIGPSVVRFKLRLSGSESVKRLQAVALDLARDLALVRVPFIDNVAGTNFVGVDLPRSEPEVVPLSPLLSELPPPGPGELPVIIGKTPDGRLHIEDLAEFPHLLVAGATNSGKSVFLRSILIGLMAQYRPGALELLIIDPKQTDFSFFEGLAYLRGGQIFTNAEASREALLELVRSEMPRRQQIMRGRSMKIKDFNQRFPAEALPPIVAMIDEYAQLLSLQSKKEAESFERDLMSLAAVARATGIHLILATQRPSVNIVTGTLKANLPARVAFQVPTNNDSRVVLDQGGAENLLGRGDMLFRRPSSELLRLQAPFMDEASMQAFVAQLRNG